MRCNVSFCNVMCAGVYVYAPPVPAVEGGSPAASQQGTAQAQPPAGPPIAPVPQQSASASASAGGAQPISTEDSHEEPDGTRRAASARGTKTTTRKRHRYIQKCAWWICDRRDAHLAACQVEGDDLQHGVDGNAGGLDGHGGDEIDHQVSRERRSAWQSVCIQLSA